MLLTKKRKTLLKPALHFVVVAIATIYFIYESSTGAIDASTPVPLLLADFLEFMISLRGFWLLPAVLILILVLAFDFSDFKAVRGWLYRLYLVVLGFLTGKFYTMAAVYLAYSYSSRHIQYFEQLSNPILIALGAFAVGLVVWFGGRALALAMIRSRSNNSSKPTLPRGAP